MSTFLSPANAEEAAEKLNEEELDGWRYEVVHDPQGTGSSFIRVWDENGDFLGKL